MKHTQVSTAEFIKQKNRYQRVKVNKVWGEDKRRKNEKEQTLQEIWDYVKRPNLRLIGVPENGRENGTKLENTLQEIIQENLT